MLYLIFQTSLILLLTAVVFSVLGAVVYRLYGLRAAMPIENLVKNEAQEVNPEALVQLEQLTAELSRLEDQVADKDRIIDGLSQALQAPVREEGKPPSESVPQEPTQEATEVHEVPAADPEGVVLLSKIPQMEAALEAQGALLESKSLALEKIKMQYDRERERSSALEQRIADLEMEIVGAKNVSAEALWGEAEELPEAKPVLEAEPAPSESAQPNQIAEREHRDSVLQSMSALSEEKDREILMLLEEKQRMADQYSHLQSESDDLHSRVQIMESEAKSFTLLQEKIGAYDRDLAEHHAVEISLRAEIERLRDLKETEKEEEHELTQEVDLSLVERLARREAELAVKREELRARDREVAARYEEKISALEAELETLKKENEMAWVAAKLEAGEAASEPTFGREAVAEGLLERGVSPPADEFQLDLSAEDEAPQEVPIEVEEADLRVRLEELRIELIQKENARYQLEDGRLEAIQRKLDHIESELLGMGESLLHEQEKHLSRAMMPADQEVELKKRITHLEIELSDKHKVIENLSLAGAEEYQQGQGLHHQVEKMQLAIVDKERVILELKKQVHELSVKLDPDLVGADNLQLVNGIGPFTKKVLKEEFGITTFKQLAELSADVLDRISERLFFKGRIQREDWLGQAATLHFKKYSEVVENPNPPYHSLRWVG